MRKKKEVVRGNLILSLTGKRKSLRVHPHTLTDKWQSENAY